MSRTKTTPPVAPVEAHESETPYAEPPTEMLVSAIGRLTAVSLLLTAIEENQDPDGWVLAEAMRTLEGIQRDMQSSVDAARDPKDPGRWLWQHVAITVAR